MSKCTVYPVSIIKSITHIVIRLDDPDLPYTEDIGVFQLATFFLSFVPSKAKKTKVALS